MASPSADRGTRSPSALPSFATDPLDLDFGPCPDFDGLSSMALPSTSEAVPHTNYLKSPGRTRLDDSHLRPEHPPSAGTVSSHAGHGLPDAIELSSDDDSINPVIQDAFQCQKPVFVKKEPQETDESIGTAAEPTSLETGPEIGCRQALEEFMANKQRSTISTKGHVQIQDEEDEGTACNPTPEIKNEACETSFPDEMDVTRSEIAESSQFLQLQDDLDEVEHMLEQHSMFFPETQPQKASSTVPLSDSDTQSDNESMNAHQSLRSLDFGLELPSEPISQPQKPRKGRPLTKKGKTGPSSAKARKNKVTKPRGQNGKKTAGRPNLPSMFNLQSLAPYDVSGQAQRNLQEPAQPRFTASRKDEALRQLIESIPEQERALYQQDKKDLLDATKKFKGQGAVKPAGEGTWSLRGMKTHLHHYQVMGCARMRENEENPHRKGGILADDMGLGKTVMALGNIVNGYPTDPTEPPKSTILPQKATLIIAPASLTSQWYSEVERHVDMTKDVKTAMIYRSSNSSHSSSPDCFLGVHDIVITSYNELNKSMPSNTPPKNLTSDAAKREWFEEHFKTHKGALHRVAWLRVVLDEAHVIKNHESKTSQAVSRLRAKYRWALSGTPIQNSLTEFYAYFRFLRVKYTGDFRLFKKNYCKRDSEKALQRLNARLESFVIRRTHEHTFFGRPIIQLPPIENRTVDLEFSMVEKTIYQIISKRFKAKVKELQLSRGRTLYSSTVMYVLLLRLRQLTAHVLLIEKTLNELLEPRDLDQLWKLANLGNHAELHESDRELLRGLEMALTIRKEARSEPESQDANVDVNTCPQTPQSESQQSSEPSSQFHKNLGAMRQGRSREKANQQSLCSVCQNTPKQPHLTSCCHVYCLSCLEDLINYQDESTGEKIGTCAKCTETFNKIEPLTANGSNNNSDEPQTPDEQPSQSRPRTLSSHESLDWYKDKQVPQSTKMRATIEQMEKWFSEPDEKGKKNKVLVFSQFRGVLKALSTICSEKNWKHQLYHGEMSMDSRNNSVAVFTTEDDCRVLLAGMKSGGVGLNLTAANKVILIDLWWNVATETQAFYRVFRIGQERPCEVVRFAIKDSIDIEILRMQERKTREIQSVLGQSGSAPVLTPAELLELFGAGDGQDAGVDEDAFIIPNDPYDRDGPDDDDNDDADHEDHGDHGDPEIHEVEDDDDED